MPIATQGSGTFTPAPAGTHLARCVGVISLGTQPANSPQFKPSFKVMLVWELPDEMVPEKNVAMTVNREYSCFLSEKANLRHDLESWRGRPFTKEELDGFDVANVIDAPCMVSVIHKTSAKKSIYAQVTGVMQLPKGVTPKPRVNELVRYEIEQGRDTTFNSLPKWIQDKIASCQEWQQRQPANPADIAQSNTPDDPGDFIPEEAPSFDPEVGF